MTCPGLYPLEVPSGSCKLFEFTLTDSNCRAVNLTNVTSLIFSVKQSWTDLDEDFVLNKVIDLTDVRHDLVNGKFVLELLEVDTRFLDFSVYYWQFRGERSSGTAVFYFPSGTPGELRILPVINRNVTPPALIEDLVATAGDTEITLNWTNPADDDVAEVVLRRSTVAYPKDHEDGDLVFRTLVPVAGAVETVVDSGLTNDIQYYYSVFSRDVVINWNDTVQEYYNSDKAIPTSS